MNSTEVTPNRIKDYFTVCSLSGVFALAAVAISTIILILVRRTKPSLHTVRHLLMCNTCVASILYCIVQTNNYIFLIFLSWETDDMGCRWRAYFSYMTLCAVTYSFLTQAISRLFISVFSTKHKWLLTYKTHHVLICVQWFVTVVIPLPAIITKDVYFRPNALCWVPLKSTIHLSYTYVVYYVIPILSICTIYVYIYYRVKKSANRAETLVRTANSEKRDLQLLRNILIPMFIYLMGGVPFLLFVITSNRILYLIGIVTISLTVAVEKVCTILLDRELRQVIRKLFARATAVVPLDITHTTAKHQENFARSQQIGMEPLPSNQNISQKGNYILHIPDCK